MKMSHSSASYSRQISQEKHNELLCKNAILAEALKAALSLNSVMQTELPKQISRWMLPGWVGIGTKSCHHKIRRALR